MLRRISAISVLFVLGMAAQAQAVMTYQEVVQADNPSYYWNWQEASGNALNSGSAAGGVLAPGSTAARVASGTTNAGGLSLGNAISFDGSATQLWAATSTIGTRLGDSVNYSNYAIEFWVKLAGTGSQYISTGNAYNAPAVIYGFGNQLELYTVPGRTGSSFSKNVADNQWHHVVLGYMDGATPGSDVQTCIVDGDYAGRETSTGIQTYLWTTQFVATNADYAIGATDLGGAPVSAGSMLANYAAYNLNSLDQAGYDAKLVKLAGHYGADGSVVPEPGTFALLAAGLAGLLAYAWRKRK